jgi:glutathione S-transferase
MKLYYITGACSLSPHIALRETGLSFDLEQVDSKTKKTKSGADFLKVNPKGYVPALQLDDGQTLTEAAVIVQYIADKKPEAKLLPPAGTTERYRAQEWLNYVATEIHKGVGALFNPKLTDPWKDVLRESVAPKFDYLSKRLEGRSYAFGDGFSVVDGYLFTVLAWPQYVGIDLAKWPVLKSYTDGIAQRPSVQAALKAEGLVKNP